MSDPYKVLIVEDDALLRSGLEIMISSEEDMEVSGTAANGLEALQLLQAAHPDLVLLDVQMPEMDGLACIREIRKLYTELPILILTTFNEEQYIFQGLAEGANGFLVKGLDIDKLVQAIRDTINRQFILPAEVAATMARYVTSSSHYMKEQRLNRFFETDDLFSDVERRIIAMLLERQSTKEMAEGLFFTEGTIKNKLTIVYEKLGVQNRHDAVRALERIILS